MTEAERRAPSFIESMPRPLFVLFAVACLVAVGVSIAILVRPTEPSVPLAERRPPPRTPFTHDAGRIAPAPTPSAVASAPPACPEVAGARPVAFGDGIGRLREVLALICPIARGGAGSEIAEAVRGLREVTIRFGGFDVTGAESTADLTTRTIWLNIKLARRRTPVRDVAPVVIHEAYHLARGPVTAATEVAARRAEVAACRQLVPIEKWPRWCHDARALTDMPPARAIALLVAAGYPR